MAEAKALTVFLGLGSNLGDRVENLDAAAGLIAERIGPVLRASSVYETEPVGYSDQPWFLNQVIEIAESRPAGAARLLDRLQAIESERGRLREIPNGPRNIDIDLLLYGDVVVGWSDLGPETIAQQDGSLIVPHPRLHGRRFVLIPLSEIAADRVHPVLGLTVRQLLESVDDRSEVRPFRPVSRQ